MFGTQMVFGSCLKQVKVASDSAEQKLMDIRELELPMVLLNKYSEKLEEMNDAVSAELMKIWIFTLHDHYIDSKYFD